MRKYGERIGCLVSDRKDGTVRMGAQQVITREVEAPERNACPRGCFDAAMQGLVPSLTCFCKRRLGSVKSVPLDVNSSKKAGNGEE